MITDVFRKIILKKKDKFMFKSYKQSFIDFTLMDKDIGLYIHIPFCKSICPYCPYNKIVYREDVATEYKKALINEIRLYKNYIKDKNITSIYIGGGTPTLLIKELKEVLGFIKEEFKFYGDIGIEVYPTEVTNDMLMSIKSLGIELISLGVQTFNDKKLRFLGRNYGSKDAQKALQMIMEFNFKCVDVDIMTNIPNQTIKDIVHDLEIAYSYNIHQISIYPLIVFPMTPMDEIIKKNNLRRFSELQERNILKIINDISYKYGYIQTSIWTYGKKHDNRYTSVTRESFIGFGAGATSLFYNYFYLNTFNVEEYIKSTKENKFSINLVNTMTDREKMIFWIFWRCYDGVISKDRFYKLFKKHIKREFKLLFTILKLLKMVNEDDHKLVLNERGKFAYHYIEKQYSIYYLNYLWEESMKKAWIDEIKL